MNHFVRVALLVSALSASSQAGEILADCHADVTVLGGYASIGRVVIQQSSDENVNMEIEMDMIRRQKLTCKHIPNPPSPGYYECSAQVGRARLWTTAIYSRNKSVSGYIQYNGASIAGIGRFKECMLSRELP